MKRKVFGRAPQLPRGGGGDWALSFSVNVANPLSWRGGEAAGPPAPRSARLRGRGAGSTWSRADAQGAWFRSGFRHRGPRGARPEKPGGEARQGRGWVTGEPACLPTGGRCVKAPPGTRTRLPPRGRLGNCRHPQRGGRAPRAAPGQTTAPTAPADGPLPPPPTPRQNTPDNTSVRQGQTNPQNHGALLGS